MTLSVLSVTIRRQRKTVVPVMALPGNGREDTVLGVFTAAGDIIPPCIVLHGTWVPSEIARKIPEGWTYGCSPDGTAIGWHHIRMQC